MEIKNKVESVVKKIQKLCTKHLNSLPYKDKEEYLDEWCIASNYSEHLYYFMHDSGKKKLIRETILDTLKSINYKKQDKWNEPSAVAFLHLSLELYKYKGSNYEHRCDLIKNMFGITENRINTQTALFILNLEKNHDNFHLYKYFTKYEIIRWKYRDNEEKLYEDMENGKLNEKDLKLIRDYYGV